jgi:hypothetical protein
MKWLYLSLLGFASVASAKETAPADAKLPVPSQRFASLEKAEEPSFRRHVIPMFSRLGCSGRECHGAFAGQGGFQLSLFGYDFDHDHKEITSDPDEVRINKESPEKSLVLQKPTMEVKHKGKERIKKGSWEYNLLLKWIQGGAKEDTEKTGEFDRLEVFPKEIVFKKAGEAVQVRVLAHWKDGTVEDVTQLTRFRTNDESVSDVSETGLVTSKEKGDTHIVAFYDNGVLPVQVMLPMSDQNGANYPKIATRTKVDELVVNKLNKLGVVPSDLCTDSEFIRRVYLDITATLPTPDQVRAFLADKSPDKRTKKIDELIKSPAHAAWMTTLLCDFTGNNPRQLNTGGQLQLNDKFSRQWYDWIYKRVSENTPYDKIVEGIVLAKGRTDNNQSYEAFAKEMGTYFRTEDKASFAERHDMPYFWQRQNVRKPEEKALAFAHTFLGVRIECAQCHKHPFDQWTKVDFQQFQAFFEPVVYGARNNVPTDKDMNYRTVTQAINEKVGYDPKVSKNQRDLQKELAKMLREGEVIPWQEVYVNPPKNTRKLTDKEIERIKKRDPNFNGRVMTPKILGGEEVMLNSFPDPRGPLMEWLRSQENPYFARAMVNRLWAHYFGRGIVEPADDMNLANPPSNAELIDHLARGFVKNGYDMHWLHREILNSDTYQRSWQTTPSNKLDEKNFSHALIRRLPAEVVFDSITMATASTASQPKLAADLESRAIGPNATISGASKASDSYTLGIFGKPARLANCDCERTSDPTLLQTIYTRNDPKVLSLVDSAKRDGSGWIDELRRQAGPTIAPGKEEAELKKLEQAKERLVRQRERQGKDKVLAEKELQKFNTEMKDIEERIARLKTGEKRETVNFDKAIEEAFLRTVSRLPTAAELAKAKEDVAAAPTPVDGVRDLLWAMLNTREFMVNH